MSKNFAIGSETAVCTSLKEGVIRLLDEELGGPLQWVVVYCMQMNYKFVIYCTTWMQTTRPRGFSELIRKKLGYYEKLPIVMFPRIETGIPGPIDQSDFSIDQKYLWEMCRYLCA